MVLAIIAVLAAITIPAMSSLSGAKFSGSLESLQGVLTLARQEATTQNTYVWALFSSATTAEGPTLTVAVVESKDGTDPIAWGSYAGTVPDNTLGLNQKLLTLSQVSLLDKGSVTVPNAPAGDNTVADLNSGLSVPVQVPARGTITFTTGLRFSPSGEARVSDQSLSAIEFDLQSAAGKDSKNVAVARIDGMTGLIRLYRP